MTEEDLDVLLVEDNPGDARLIEIELSEIRRGTIDLTWVDTLKAGLEHATEEHPDAVLLDLYLPDSSGLDTVQAMYEKGPSLPIVVLTGMEDEEMGIEAVRQGAQDYLVKGEVDGPRMARTLRYAVERQQAQEELEELRRQVAMSDRLASLGALVSGMAREIRDSTTQITNALFQIRQRIEQSARMNPQLTELMEDVSDYNASALDGVSRIEGLVRDLGHFTESGPQGRKDASLDEPVRDAAELFRKTYRSSINVDIDLQETPELRLNTAQIQQVVLNLLRNSADAMSEGGSVQVRTFTEGDDVVLEVEDDGEGLTRYVQQRMFEPFFSTRESDGLGLAIVERIVDAHHGEIECHSVKGEGTTMRVRFPVPRDETGDG